MKIKIVGLILTGLILASGTARAAILELDLGSSSMSIVPTSFGPVGFPGGLVIPGTTPITVYTNGDTGGLRLSGGEANIIVKFLGSEASATNSFTLGTAFFSNSTMGIGTTNVVAASEGNLPFSFSSSLGGGRTATNGGTIHVGTALAFSAVGDGFSLSYLTTMASSSATLMISFFQIGRQSGSYRTRTPQFRSAVI